MLGRKAHRDEDRLESKYQDPVKVKCGENTVAGRSLPLATKK
jgi:hypothetical protein